MTELSDLMHSTRNKNVVPGTIKDITVWGTFHTGFLDLNYYYETPMIQLTIETDFETVHLTTEVKNFFESSVSELILDRISNTLDLKDLIDEDIYIAFSDNFNTATIGLDMNVEYDQENGLIKDTKFSGDMTDIEERSIEYGNEKLKNDFHIKSEGVEGWIQAEFSYEGEINSTYVFSAELKTGTKLYWTFDATNIESSSEIRSFLDVLGIKYTTEEFDKEYIWVKRIHQVHHTNRKNTRLMLDSEEKWTARSNPQNPTVSKWNKIKQKLNLTHKSINVELEVGDSDKRIANSSETRDSFKEKEEDFEPMKNTEPRQLP